MEGIMKIKLGFGILASAALMAGCNPYGGDNFVEIISHESLDELVVSTAEDKLLASAECKTKPSAEQFCLRYPLPKDTNEFIKVWQDRMAVGPNAVFPESSSMIGEGASWIFGGQSQTVKLFDRTNRTIGIEKLSADGQLLPDDAETWACARDTATGNVWETKNTDVNSLHYVSHDLSYWDGSLGIKSQAVCGNGTCDTSSLIAQSNAETLCGLSNWTLPSQSELVDISLKGNVVAPYLTPLANDSFYSRFFWTNKTLPFIPDTSISDGTSLLAMPSTYTPGISDFPYVIAWSPVFAIPTLFVDPSQLNYNIPASYVYDEPSIKPGAVLISRPE
jgi:hypothetical protein